MLAICRVVMHQPNYAASSNLVGYTSQPPIKWAPPAHCLPYALFAELLKNSKWGMEPAVDVWRLYVYKDAKPVADHPIIQMHTQTVFLFGRSEGVCDVVLQHPSCSSQHAVMFYRRQPNTPAATIDLVVVDLASTNGTLLNDVRCEPWKEYAVRHKDVLSFGQSSRTYVAIIE